MLTTTIPINTLSGGVGRQAPPKRLPKEAEILENVLCTVERSVEKRPGVEQIPFQGDPSNENYNGYELPIAVSDNVQFFWHSLSDDVRFLIGIDRDATASGDLLYYVFYFNPNTQSFEDHTPATQTDTEIDPDVRAYLTYGGENGLKFVAQAQSLLFLNTEVFAGYTSKPKAVTTADYIYDAYTGIPAQPAADTTLWLEVGLDGRFIGSGTVGDPWTEDGIGREVDYLTASEVDPQGIAPYWSPFESYASGTTVLYLNGSQTGATRTTSLIYSVKSLTTPDADVDDVVNWKDVTDRTAARISVKDWKYPDPSKPYLGQSVPTFQDLRFPPPDVDVESGNNNAEDMLAALYDLDNPSTAPHENSAEGKVYYVQGGFQGQAPGYYIMKSQTAPHTMKVRTPDGYSVIDSKRMPMQIQFVGFDAGTGLTQWEWTKVDWAHRTSGDLGNNPGPTPFKNGKQSRITTLAYFRNRLWMSAGDVIFSSRSNDFSDLWIEDPGVITDTDPIDIAASSNKYTPITAMVPFTEYMFVNTSADTQYELMGSENQITPFTAELQPMTFYSTAPLVEPLTLGNHIFFYDKERLYMYLGRGGTLSTAQELSAHCPKFLPERYGPTVVAGSQDSLLAVDADEPSVIYLYTTRYRGNEIAQNAFYTFRIDGAEILTMRVWDNHLVMVNKRGTKLFTERVSLRYEDNDDPHIDRRLNLTLSPGAALDTIDPKFGTGVNAVFDSAANTTTFRIPYADSDIDTVILGDGFDENLGVSLVVDTIDSASGLYTDITFRGDLTTGNNIWVGKSFLMVIQLSPQFLRDDNNNIREGVLNMASMTTRHFNTGNYDVLVQRSGRPTDDILAEYGTRFDLDSQLSPFITNFSAKRMDMFTGSELPSSNIEYQGDMHSRIMGFSDRTEIFILSDYWTPVNITNIEIKGKFKQTYSSI
jgi:hypothetical protein